MLGEIATTAARSKTSHSGERYRRLAARRGKKRALVATGHSVLVAAGTFSPAAPTTSTSAPTTTVTGPQTRPPNARLLAERHALGYQTTLHPTG